MMRSFLLILLVGAALTSLFCERDATAQVRIEEAFPKLRFERPTDLANDGLGNLYVTEQAGRIYVFPNDSTTQDTTAFLDIRERILFEIEAGLLGLAFHPEYEENGFFYIYYVTENPLRSVLSRWERSDDDPLRADPSSELVLLEVEQPTSRHNGGDISFDGDGYLYLSLGDGSQGRDQYENAQNLNTLLGSIIRIDVDNPSQDRPYGLPPDNPFAGNLSGYREEIYAYGFRNPWRFSIDPNSQDIWVGDVGEQTWEEIDYVINGGNYGWPIMEGPVCYQPPENCTQEGLYPPVWAYGHEMGRSVIGGYVYRGSRVPELYGKYIFAEWDSSQVWAVSYEGNPYENEDLVEVDEILNAERFISSFGVDEVNELYMLFTFEGRVMRFGRSDVSDVEKPIETALHIEAKGPNPFSSATHIEVGLGEGGPLKVDAYDLMGRHVRTLFQGFLPANDVRRITFDAGALPSGVYFCRVQGGGRIETLEFVIVR